MKNFAQKIKIDVPSFDLILIIGDNVNWITKNLYNLVKNKKIRNVLEEWLIWIVEEWCHGWYLKEDKVRLMWIKDWKNDWNHWDTLNHEVNHLVEYESQDKSFTEEMEFKAYLQEGTFRKLRELLSDKYR